MTDQTQPTDAELWAAIENYASAVAGANLDMLVVRKNLEEVVAKWGTPAEVVAWRLCGQSGKGGEWQLGRPSDEFKEWVAEHHPGSRIEYAVATPQPTQAQAGAVDGTWCVYVAGMICTYLNEDAEGPKAKAIAGIIERRLMFLSKSKAPFGRDTLYLLRRLLSNQFTLSSAEFRTELEKIVGDEIINQGADHA